jgi:hypothetical protein
MEFGGFLGQLLTHMLPHHDRHIQSRTSSRGKTTAQDDAHSLIKQKIEQLPRGIDG